MGVPEIRNFRGAIVGRADRGMFITTGSFTKAAIEEAKRDGAAPVDLVDGDQLADKLKEMALGIKTGLVEKVTVEPEWFLSLQTIPGGAGMNSDKVELALPVFPSFLPILSNLIENCHKSI